MTASLRKAESFEVRYQDFGSVLAQITSNFYAKQNRYFWFKVSR
jgi:hypothetical protein